MGQNPPLLDGTYCANGSWYTSIVVTGTTAVSKDGGSSNPIDISLGDFGEADSEVAEVMGETNYNIKIDMKQWDLTELGVISQDGLKIVTKGMMGLATLEWKTEEEAAAIEAAGDPIDAPPGPYKIQPENVGKLLFISGSPGLGKSSTAQLLARTHGYVYYESDCFYSCRNPYIPLDVAEPSLAQMKQASLKGEGLKERQEANKSGSKMFEDLMAGKKIDNEIAKGLYGAMCDDIKRERERIGGDWAVAGFVMNRELRDFMRSKLGPDLIFVLLDMEEEDIKERVRTRHKGSEQAVNMLVKFACEPIAEDEEKAVTLKITKDMTREDVVEKILGIVDVYV